MHDSFEEEGSGESTGSDSIDPELFRPPIPTPGSGLYPSLYSFLNILFEPSISQYPGFIGRLSDFAHVLRRYCVLE
jgi:hypothetical protein